MRQHWRRLRLDLLDRVSLFALDIAADGRLPERRGWPRDWAELRRRVRQQGGRFDLTLFLSSPAALETLFTREAHRQRLLQELLALAREVDDLQLDIEVYEPISPAAKAGVRLLCERLRQDLPAGVGLSAFGPVGAAVDLYDAELVPLLDHLVVQGYDYHHPASRQAGPLAPLQGPDALTWPQALAHHLGLGWPRHKLLFSLPLYGYEWPVVGPQPRAATVGQARTTSYAAGGCGAAAGDPPERAGAGGAPRRPARRGQWLALLHLPGCPGAVAAGLVRGRNQPGRQAGLAAGAGPRRGGAVSAGLRPGRLRRAVGIPLRRVGGGAPAGHQAQRMNAFGVLRAG
jgi:hypothetical protein